MRIYTADLEHYIGKKVELFGWVWKVRVLGKIAFVVLRDREGHVQCVLKKNVEKVRDLNVEDVVKVVGFVREGKTKEGIEVAVEDIELIAKAVHPLPLDTSGTVVSELDTRLKARHIDLRNPKVSAIFRIRTLLLKGIRDYLVDHGFVEVHTPKILVAGAEGGATLFPLKYFERDAYLAQSPQLFKQILMASGLDYVFEIGNYFRAEKSDTARHLAEFTMWDVEMAFIKSKRDVMALLMDTLQYAIEYVFDVGKRYVDVLGINPPNLEWTEITYENAIKLLRERGYEIPKGEDIDTRGEKILGDIMQEKGYDFYFITEFPLSTRHFYIMEKDGSSQSFDLDFRGLEIASGGQREHRYDVLIERIRKEGLNPENFSFYTEAFKHGMPPHGGFGLGIDRLVQKLVRAENVREVVLFPRDRYRVVP